MKTDTVTQNEIQNAVFLLLRWSLWGEDTLDDAEREALLHVTDWRAVFTEMKHQTVQGLVAPLLDRLPIADEALRQEWKLQCMHDQMRWYQILAGQQELLALMEEEKIPCVILKGAAAGLQYPNPVLRCSGDVDFLVKREDYFRAALALEENGYLVEKDEEDSPHHRRCGKNGVCFELHRRMARISEDDETLLCLFEKGIDQRETAQIDRFSFPRLPTFQNGLSLLLHLHQHLRLGIGLRQITDWMCFAQKTLSDQVWKEQFRPYLQKLGLETFAVTVTELCRTYLGLWSDADPAYGAPTWSQGADRALCRELMEHVVEKGNFGYKSADDGHITFFYININNPVQFFKRIQEGGLERWKSTRKYPILRPFAWFYQFGHILRELIRQKRTPRAMLALHKSGQKQEELFKKLGPSAAVTERKTE